MSLWRHRDFRRFWSAQGVSELGDRVTELAIPLIAVTTLHASPQQVGLLTAVVWLPYIPSIFIGAWVDQQRRKRRLMIAADLFRLVVLVSLPLAAWGGVLGIGQLYGVALLTGAAKVVFDTSYLSFFVRLVTKEQYVEANSKLSSTRAVSFIAGPAVGGALIQILTAPLAVAVDAVSFAFSALQISRVRVADVEPDRSEGSLLGRARDGMVFLFRDRLLRTILCEVITVNFFNFVGQALLVLFASRELGLSAGQIGLAFGVGAAGGLVGAVTAPKLSGRVGLGPLSTFGAVVFPGAIAIAAFADGPVWLRIAVLGLAELVGGFGVMCLDVPLNSLMAAATPDSIRSRVAGAFSTLNYGCRPLGAVLGGALGGWIGVRESLLVSAIGGALSVLWLIGSPVLRVRDLSDIEPAPLPVASGPC